jgi:hypothetical protein
MSQTNIVARERTTFVGEESAFGSVPAGTFPNAMTLFHAIGDDLSIDPTVEMLDVMDERVRRDDNVLKVKGLKLASKVGSLKGYLKATPTASQLTASATAGSLPQRLLCRHAFGVEYATAGSTVLGTASTTTVVNVAAGHGTRFRKGTWIAVEVAGEMEAAKITNISTDALTIAPALSAAPDTGGEIVRNLYNYTRGEANTNSLSVRQAFVGDTTAQHTFSGCYGNITFELPEWGKLPSMALALTATDFTVGAQSISVAGGADPAGASAQWAPLVYLAAAVDRSTPLACTGVTYELMDETELVRDPSKTSTVASIVRTGGRPVAAKATVKLRFDNDYDAAFAADTSLSLVTIWKIGTGTTASFHILELPAGQLVGQPKRIKVGERLHMELDLEGLIDSSVTLAAETGDALAAVKSSLRYAFG